MAWPDDVRAPLPAGTAAAQLSLRGTRGPPAEGANP